MSELVLENDHVVPNNWASTNIAEILKTLESGKRPKGGVKNIKKGIASIGGEHLTYDGKFQFNSAKFIPRDFYNSMNTGHIKRNDILIVKDGATTGKTSFVSKDFPYVESAVNEHVFIIRTFENLINPRYLFYFFSSPFGYQMIKSKITGSAQGGINTSFVKDFPIIIPPLNEQKRIIEKIEVLFLKIDSTVDMLKNIQLKMKNQNKLFFKEIFTGNLTKDFRKNSSLSNEKNYFENIIQDIERYSKKTENLINLNIIQQNPLPKTWNWTHIGKICLVVRGGSPRPAGSSKYFGGIIPWITVKNLTEDDDMFLNKVDEFLNEEGKKRSRYLESETLMLTNSGATLGVPKISKINGCINDGIVALLHVDSPLKEFLYYYLKNITNKLRMLNQGAAQPNLNTTIVKSIPIPLPPKNEQKIILEIISKFVKNEKNILSSIEITLKKLDMLKKTILKQAFEGKLVRQDPNDESAEILLQKIKHEKEQYEKKIKQEKQQLKQKSLKRKKNVS